MKRLTLALSLLLSLCGSLSAAELRVGTTQPYMTVPAAVAAARTGDVVTLVDDAATWPSELAMNRAGVTLRSLSGDARPLIRYTGRPAVGGDQQSAIKITAAGVTVDGIQFAPANAKAISVDRAANVTLRNLTVDGARGVTSYGAPCGAYYGVEAVGTANLRIENVALGLVESYGLYIHGGNRNTTIVNPRWVGSVGQHACRVSDQDTLLIDGGQLLAPITGPGIKHAGGISLRGGCHHILIRNATVERPGIGAQTGAEAQDVDDVVFENCKILGGVALHPTSDEIRNEPDPVLRAKMRKPTGVKVNGVWLTPPLPTTQPATVPAPTFAQLIAQLRALPGMPAAAGPILDELAGMGK